VLFPLSPILLPTTPLQLLPLLTIVLLLLLLAYVPQQNIDLNEFQFRFSFPIANSNNQQIVLLNGLLFFGPSEALLVPSTIVR